MKRNRVFDPEEQRAGSGGAVGKRTQLDQRSAPPVSFASSFPGAVEPAPWVGKGSGGFGNSGISAGQVVFGGMAGISNGFGGSGDVGKSSTTMATTEQTRREKFLKHLRALNTQFADMAESVLKTKPLGNLADACNDYLKYASDLEERYLRQYGEVFTFGSGECGQLAHGVEDPMRDCDVRRPRIVHSLRDKRVRLLACGGLHTVALGDDGRVWSWGCNDDGALGRPTGPVDPEDLDKGMKGDENIPGLVSAGGLAGQQVELVACGDSHTLAMTVDGNIFGWGSYKDKEGKKWFDQRRGVSEAKDIKRQQNEPMHIQSLPNGAVEHIACGATFNVCLLRGGKALLWGLGECGQLARKVTGWDATPPATTMRNAEGDYLFDQILADHMTPKAPEMGDGQPLPPFKAIGAGAYHVFFIASEGRVYAAGLNTYGQLGLDDELRCVAGNAEPTLVHTQYWQLEPVKPLEGRGITEIVGGHYHSIALAASFSEDASESSSAAASQIRDMNGNLGKIYTWGRSDYGQLGVEGVDTKAGGLYNYPMECPLPPAAGKVVSIACGENHNLVLTQKGKDLTVYAWGFGESGALGQGNKEEDETRPTAIDLAKAKHPNVMMVHMAAGAQHTALLGIVTSTK